MPPSPSILREALSHVFFGKKVLFLTSDRNSTDIAANQAHLIVLDTLDRAHLPENRVVLGSSPWHIHLEGAGWIFFFPRNELDPSEDVQNPDLVFQPDRDIQSMPYLEWKRAELAPPPMQSRDAWSRLMDDD
jgi:hypothetical protein